MIPREEITKQILDKLNNAEFKDIVNYILGDFFYKTLDLSDMQEIADDLSASLLVGHTHYYDEILPRNCRFFFPIGGDNGHCAVVEHQPRMRTITTNGLVEHFFLDNLVDSSGLREESGLRGESCRWRLAFPYVYYVCCVGKRHLNSMSVFFAKKPIQKLTDEIYIPPLPNIPGSGFICLQDNFMNRADTVAGIVDLAIDAFYSFKFTEDNVSDAKLRLEGSNITSIADWHRRSVQDPFFIFKERFRSVTSLEKVFKYLNVGKDSMLENIQYQVKSNLSYKLDFVKDKIKKSFLTEKNLEVVLPILERLVKSMIYTIYSETYDYFKKNARF